tara:strand:- start:260 stop:442 length:183 start_codon:yes stop_codon:yes gene_type:complete
MKVASLFSILAFVANGFSPLPAVTTVKVSQTHVASSTPDFSTKVRESTGFGGHGFESYWP